MPKSTAEIFDELVERADDTLLKELNKLLNRIERLMVPTYFYSHCKVADRLSRLRKRLSEKEFLITTTEFTKENIVKAMGKLTEQFVRRVDWIAFEEELRSIIGNHPDDSFYLKEVNGEIEHQKHAHLERYSLAIAREKICQMQIRNNQPVMTGKWRKDAYPIRTRVQLTDYVPTDSISAEEGLELMNQLNTPLNGYVGQAYNYDDRGLTEEWMTSFRNGATAASEEEVARTQLVSLMEIMLSKVQDRIYNEEKILEKPPIVLSKDVVEQPVWGIDSYTRKMIEICLEDGIPRNQRSTLTIKDFIEHVLLPAINRQTPEMAHNLANALQSIVDVPTVSARDHLYASKLMESFREFGYELFKIHPKGTGVVCINPEGIPPQVLIAEYLGELYPAYRWCERLDVIEQAQKQLEMKPTLPDFYNILLERPRQDPSGYGLLYVDASQKANIGSSCSHSCDANCTSAIVARDGRLRIAMTTNRHVRYGEELTFDYYSITTSDVEWRAAVCLCGMTSCRGSFLAYATQEDLQQVLNQNFGPVSRYASLLRACADRKPSNEDNMTLRRHGIKQAILGNSPPNWMTKYAADVLRFVEFERKALPCSLLRPRQGISTEYTFSGADMDARCVMEQRIQSMVCCFSMINRVLIGQPQKSVTEDLMVTSNSADGAATTESVSAASPITSFEKKPLQPIAPRQVMQLIWARLCKIPSLIETYCLNISDKTPDVKAIRAKRAEVEAMLVSIRELLQIEPTSMLLVRETCLKIRKIVFENNHLSYAKARFLQLADILALWAFTVNFSVPQEYEVVEAAPIEVPARELGSTVPRSVLEKARMKEREKEAQRRRKERRQLAEIEFSLYDDIDQIAAGMRRKARKATPNSITTSVSTEDLQVEESTAVEVTKLSSVDGEMVDSNVQGLTKTKAMDIAESSVENATKDSISREEGNGLVTSESSHLVVDTATEVAMDVDEPTTSITHEEGKGATEVSSLLSSEQAGADTVDSMADENATSNVSSQTQPQQQLVSNSDKKHMSVYLDPNDPVFTGRKVYDKWFCFWQLMDWFNAGSDQKTEHPDLFGCVELPDPSACFGTSTTLYTVKHQQMLVNILKDDKLQVGNWPAELKTTFNLEHQDALLATGERVYGSPMLDVVLGQIDSVFKALKEIMSTMTVVNDGKSTKGKGRKSNGGSNSNNSSAKKNSNARRSLNEDEEERQLDEVLAPEAPTSWVQCDSCHKWRRVPWHVDLEALSDPWACSQNTWDIDTANCDAPQDMFDASKENAMYSDQEAENKFTLDQFVHNSWWDVFCTKNLVYYEAQVVKVREPGGKKKGQTTEVLFHYKGWSHKFDEWIPFDSDRISRHNLFTNPMASDPREQERWQGMQPVTAVVTSAYHNKKRKSSDGTEENNSNNGNCNSGNGGSASKKAKKDSNNATN